MKLNDVLQAISRPQLYSPGTATMWDDEHISKQLLEVHLNPNLDLASRKPATILSTIEWLEEHAVSKKGAAILDMGCGPGLYTEILARKDYQVSGIDISANSIRYAREAAAKSGLNISYRNLDYASLEDTEAFDLIMMIFTDFGVLIPEIRSKILKNIHRALKPGGVFCFDFLNSSFPIEDVGTRDWEICKGGFWSEESYLLLQEKYYYPEENVYLSQHIVADDNLDTSIYRFWTHAFSHKRVEVLLQQHGFHGCTFHENILTDCDLHNPEHVSFCLARK